MTYSAPTIGSPSDPIQIVVYSEDPGKVNLYTVKLTGTVALTDMNPNNIIDNPTIEYAINVQNGCLTDVIDFTSITFEGSAYDGSDIVYYIEDTTKTFVPTWS